MVVSENVDIAESIYEILLSAIDGISAVVAEWYSFVQIIFVRAAIRDRPVRLGQPSPFTFCSLERLSLPGWALVTYHR